MPKLHRSRPFRIAASSAVFIAACGFVLWTAFHPKIQLATEAEIRAVLPKELLIEAPVDRLAQERYKELLALIGSLDKVKVDQLLESRLALLVKPKTPGAPPLTSSVSTLSASEQYAEARRLWSSAPSLSSQVSDLLNAGPLQVTTDNSGGKPSSADESRVKSIISTLTVTAELATDCGDFNRSTEMLSLAVRLDARMLPSGGTLMDHLNDAFYDSITMRAIRHAVENPNFPPENCRRILNLVSPAPVRDVFTAQAIRTDFQKNLKFLALDPRTRAGEWGNSIDSSGVSAHVEPFSGTYDAIETAKIWGDETLAQIANTAKPFAMFDQSSDVMAKQLVGNLPKTVGPERPEGIDKWKDKLRYRFQMDNGHNTIGRIFLNAAHWSRKGIIEASCRWRANRDETRVFLASRIFRASHHGQLPESVDGFRPLIGEWPMDPFNGQKLIYDPKEEKAYSVGPNLIDDKGDIGLSPGGGKDMGISLKLGVRTKVVRPPKKAVDDSG